MHDLDELLDDVLKTKTKADKDRECSRNWYYRNRKRHNRNCKNWYERHKGYKKNLHLKAKFNISLEDYDKMLFAQDNKCNICGAHSSKFPKALHVDHCHKTGKVRALLCFQCNQRLSWYERFTEKILNHVKA